MKSKLPINKTTAIFRWLFLVSCCCKALLKVWNRPEHIRGWIIPVTCIIYRATTTQRQPTRQRWRKSWPNTWNGSMGTLIGKFTLFRNFPALIYFYTSSVRFSFVCFCCFAMFRVLQTRNIRVFVEQLHFSRRHSQVVRLFERVHRRHAKMRNLRERDRKSFEQFWSRI